MADEVRFARRAILAAGAAGSCGLLAACVPFVHLPRLPTVVRLRTSYFHNARFPRVEPVMQDAVLGHARTLAAELLGLALEFGPATEMEIGAAFRPLDEKMRARLTPTMFDFRSGRGDRPRLVAQTRRNLEAEPSTLEAMLRYARPHLLRPPASFDHDGLAQAAVDTELERIDRWRELRGSDGKPLIDDSLYNEYNAWLAVAAASDWPFEVILTNQLLVSVEYDNNQLHSSLRGGLSNGLTSVSQHSRYGTVSVLSLFPFTSNDAVTVGLRGGARAQGQEPAVWAAAVLVHELGHQLLHLNHPFGQDACVMDPPQLLLFRDWVARLKREQCAIGSTPAMTPGAVRFRNVRRAPQSM